MTIRYFVTGASGLLGKFLVPHLVECGYGVVCLENSHKLEFENQAVLKVGCDLVQRKEIESLLCEISPDVIIHAAGITNVDQCERDSQKAKLLNTEIPSWLSQWSENHGKQYVFISSDHVTAGVKPFFTEEDPVSAVNVYAQTKIEAEKEILQCAHTAKIIRTNFFGKGPFWRKSLTDWLWEKAMAGEIISAFTDSYFSPLSARYLSKAIVDLSVLPVKGIFHVGGSERVSKHEFALKFLAAFDMDVDIVRPSLVRDANLIAPRPMDMSMAVTKIENTLGYKMPDLQESFDSIRIDYRP